MLFLEHGAVNGYPVKFLREKLSPRSYVTENALLDLEQFTFTPLKRIKNKAPVKVSGHRRALTDQVEVYISQGSNTCKVELWVIPANEGAPKWYILGADALECLESRDLSSKRANFKTEALSRAVRLSHQAANQSVAEPVLDGLTYDDKSRRQITTVTSPPAEGSTAPRRATTIVDHISTDELTDLIESIMELTQLSSSDRQNLMRGFTQGLWTASSVQLKEPRQ
jgi:hypothetical protein